MLGAEAELPEGYTAVDYIVAPKGAYIDTGYEPNQNTRVVMDVTVQGALEYWFGCWTNDYNRGAFALGNDGEYGIYYAIGDDGGSFKKVEGGQDGRVPDGRQTVEVTPWEFKVNAVTWTEKVESSRKDFQLDQPLYLFAQNRKGKAFVNAAQGDIICHGCKIYEGSDLVRDFVPCVRVSDQAVGLYDLAESDPGKAFYANKGSGAFAIPPEARCTVTIGDYPHMTAAWTSGDGSVTNAVSGNSFSILRGMKNVKVIFTVNQDYAIIEGDPVVELGNVESDIVFGEGNDYAVPTAVCTLGEVPYLDWDDVEKKMTNATLTVEYEIVSSETQKFEDGKWYVAAEAVEISGHNIKVSGSAHLILCDNASLTVKNVGNLNAAIDVSANGSVTNSLTIYGQQDGSGTVTATGGGYGAGIGGGYHGTGGIVTINGGSVTATGGDSGAGIGGGEYGAGGFVTINGGLVTATGGENGAGIGGGYDGEDGKVELGKNVEVVEGMYGNGSSYAKIVEAWTLGEAVTAYVNDDGTLVIGGTGAMDDFASAADAPWAAIADEITAVTIAESVTHVGKNAFAGMENLTSINGEDVKSTYRTVSTVNGKPIEQFNMMGGALGYAPLAYPSESSALPSGAISGAEFEQVQIIDGKAYLDVSVYTSDAITNQNWSVATNGVIEVPAPGKQGFFYLMSKPAVPSNLDLPPIVTVK